MQWRFIYTDNRALSMWRMCLTGKLLPVVIILGATATGKTALSLELAQRWHGEIISADSRQIYRQMDIGTAKATLAQRQQVPHHLLDIVNPDENLTAAEYQTLAYQTIDTLHAQGKLPFLVGGTGQYITVVEEGWSIPHVAPDWALRAELEAFAADKGKAALYERLVAVDPQAATAIHPNNVRRVIRALEVYLVSGTPISVLQQKKPPPYQFLRLGLAMPREKLYPRADTRVEAMLTDGFVDEVRALLARGYARNLPAMTGVGYAELAAHLSGECTYAEAVQRTKFNTHDFIRRQEVWFRGHDHGILWHNVDEFHVDTLHQLIASWLSEA
jgi:tRNA dimethylallyltransferase